MAQTMAFFICGCFRSYFDSIHAVDRGCPKEGPQVYYLFGDLAELVAVIDFATRSDLRRVVRGSATEFVFWVGHGNKNGIQDCDENWIDERDFENSQRENPCTAALAE